MGKVRVLSIPVALVLTLAGSTAVPGTHSPSPSRLELGPGGPARPAAAATKEARISQPITRPIGDFNGDTFADLAIGAPFEDTSGRADGGGVNVIYGSGSGLAAAGNQYWDQNSQGIGDAVEASDQFGFAAVAGDFNQDGFGDLAVGVPLEDAPLDSGAVNVLYGSPSGLTASGNQVWSQNSQGIGDSREPEDHFGRALAAGDFNGDGAFDLAIGVPFEDVSGRRDPGGVNVIYGSPSGLTANGNQFWHQGSPGIAGTPAGGDNFGFATTAADFNGDSFDDLAVGVPNDDPARAGAVNVIFGSASGLRSAGNQLWHQNSPGIRGVSEATDLFGYCLAGGDFDGDGFDDLAMGVPFEDVATKANGGAVSVIYGSAGGLGPSGNQQWSQDSPGIRGASEARDQFGFALAVEDFNGDNADDLPIGIPGEDPRTNAGAIAVIFGGPPGLSPAGNEVWSQTQLPGSPAEAWDGLGFSLAAGRFDEDMAADLAIGVPFEDVATKKDAGAVNVVYGSPGGLDPATSQIWSQDALGRLSERADRFGFAGGGHVPG